MKNLGTNIDTVESYVNEFEVSGSNSNGTIFFEKDIIYSYGEHFPMAKRIKDNVYLLTTKNYSQTTSNHLSLLRNALCGMIFNVPNLNKAGIYDNVENYRKRISLIAKKSKRARSNKEFLLSTLTDIINEANEYSKFFKLKVEFKNPLQEEQDNFEAQESPGMG